MIKILLRTFVTYRCCTRLQAVRRAAGGAARAGAWAGAGAWVGAAAGRGARAGAAGTRGGRGTRGACSRRARGSRDAAVRCAGACTRSTGTSSWRRSCASRPSAATVGSSSGNLHTHIHLSTHLPTDSC